MMLSNIETVAREVCAQSLRRRCTEGELAVLVDRYWHVVAALIEAGLIEPDSSRRSFDFEAGEVAYSDWLSRRDS